MERILLTRASARWCKATASTCSCLPRFHALRLLTLLALVTFTGCETKRQTEQERYDAAKALFEQTSKEFHIPSAEAKHSEKQRLQNQAGAGYEQLLEKYPEQNYWAAQALRSLGNIRAARGNLDQAVKLYAAVEKRYPQRDWELLMAWKSAGDLLWDAERREEANSFYRKIIARFDNREAPQVIRTVVRGCQMRLAGAEVVTGK